MCSSSYPSVIYDLNKAIYDNPDVNFTVVGLDELAKAKSSTLFFLSKNGFLGNNIKFIKSKDIDDEWKKCGIWITDSEEIIDKCPKNKKSIKFNTDYNQHFSNDIEINDLTKINELCLKSWGKTTTSILTRLLTSAASIMGLKNKKKT